jgi:hypothetical protein
LETNSNRRRDVEAANPLPDGVSDLPEFPTGDLPGAEQSEAQTLTEENYDHLVGKTTAAALDETAGEGANFLHAVGQAAAEALESEREFLADRQALVDAGEAWWVKNDDDDRSERQ